MVSIFCIGLGELLTLAAMVLGIFINVGQISKNAVGRNIYYTSLDTTGFDATLRTLANQNNVNVGTDVYASDQAAVEGDNRGLKNTYKWGLYSFCAGSGSDVACSTREFGYDYQPLTVLQQDIPTEYQQFVAGAIPADVFQDETYLARFTNAANYIAFVATVVVGASFLVAFLAHRFAFLLAALLALAACGLFFVAAAIWTAIIFKVRHSLSESASTDGIDVSYGNAIWMCWAAGGAAVLAVVPLLIGCISGRRSKY